MDGEESRTSLRIEELTIFVPGKSMTILLPKYEV